MTDLEIDLVKQMIDNAIKAERERIFNNLREEASRHYSYESERARTVRWALMSVSKGISK
jgi:hypothetical protein